MTTPPASPARGEIVRLDGEHIRVIYDERTIAERVLELARAVAASEPLNLLVVPVLKGSFIFAADLLRAFYRVGLLTEVDFMILASYGAGTTSSGTVNVLRDIETDVTGRDVLLVEDILETGRTLAAARDLLRKRGARRVMTAVLLDKQVERAADVAADFAGFTCPDVFVVGYGMDKAHAYRELPFIGEVLPDEEDAGKAKG